MKVFINRKPIDGPWGGGNNFVKALYKHLPKKGIEISKDFTNLDYVFLQSPKPCSDLRFSINEAIKIKSLNKKTKIILRVNECDARKNTKNVDELWAECSKHVDITIFVSKWMMNYFLEKGWYCKNNYVVYNGVNMEYFKPGNKINNRKINIVTHHWSNNRLKGFDEYEKLDEIVGLSDNYTFTYIGRELGTFKNTQVIKPLFGESLGKELGKYDVYLSASRFDPGPNHVLESLACRIPTYIHSDGGGCVEFAGGSHVYSDIKDFIDKIKKPKDNQYDGIVRNWNDCVEEIVKILKKARDTR